MTQLSKTVSIAARAVCLAALLGVPAMAQNPGAIFTSNSACDGTNVNLFAAKADVYLDGGPVKSGTAGLTPGSYAVKVTTPEGTLLGTSVGSGNDTPAVVDALGEFAVCYHLSAILIRPNGQPGYNDTTNPGGEYKVWVSLDITFPSNSTKTDNFKVQAKEDCVVGCGEPTPVAITGTKFYDANLDGIQQVTEPGIPGWRIEKEPPVPHDVAYTNLTGVYSFLVAPGSGPYTISEVFPGTGSWVNTTALSVGPVIVGTTDVAGPNFGNVCLGAGGGLTLGFWSNKNGEARFNTIGGLAAMVALNLRDAAGDHFNPTSYNSSPISTAFRHWLLTASATNMAYMLSAQLAAMQLNVLNGNVSGGSFLYAPGTTSANAFGFATVSAIITEANSELGLHGLVLSGSPFRAYQEALKNALDKANNNLNFVQGSLASCPAFTTPY